MIKLFKKLKYSLPTIPHMFGLEAGVTRPVTLENIDLFDH